MTHYAKQWSLNRLLVDTTPLRESPAFAKLWASNAVAQVGAQATIVAVGLHIYQLTGSTLAVSLVALWALGPMILAGVIGGALADIFDRRLVAVVTAVIAWVSIGLMTTIAFLGVSATWPYYALAAVNAASATIMGTARGAIIPRLIPANLLPAASALGGITMGVAVTLGPAVAGVLVAAVGVPWTYLLDTVLFTAGFFGLVSLPPIPVHRDGATPHWLRAAFSSIFDSVRFLRTAPNVRSTFIYDIVAMTLGQPRVVFPAAGALVLGGGAVTVGALTAAFAVGSLLSSLFSGPLGRVQRQGRAVTYAITVYGAAIAGFGIVLLVTGISHGAYGAGALGPSARSLEADSVGSAILPVLPAIVLGGVMLAVAGAADNVSSVFRTTILQSAAPDDVLGRMQGLFYVVVAGGPRIGDLLAGVIATAIALWATPLIGGCMIVAIMLVMLWRARNFQSYDARNPQP